MSIREFLDALRSTQGQHTLASVLEGRKAESGFFFVKAYPSGPQDRRVCWPGISRRWPGVVQAAS